MFPIIAAIVSIAISIYSYVSASKMKQADATAGDFQTTAADEGNSINVVFGTVDVSPNVTAFLAGTPQAIQK